MAQLGNRRYFELNISTGICTESILIFIMNKVKDKADFLKLGLKAMKEMVNLRAP